MLPMGDVWRQGFGFADREARRPSTAHTAYSLASISKPITATGLVRCPTPPSPPDLLQT